MRSLCSALYFLSSTERNGFLMNIYSEVLGRCRSKMAAPMFTCTFSCGLLQNMKNLPESPCFCNDKHLLALEHPGEGLPEESHGAAQRLWKVRSCLCES